MNTIDGELRPVLSQGSHSFEFMRGNFLDREIHDTIYITANPHAAKLPNDIFYDIKMILDSYMQPEKVIEYAIETNEFNPNKRLIVHLMPPHRPHFGPTADRLREQFNLKDWSKVDKLQDVNDSGRSIWNLAIHDEITIKELRQSYRETLNIALELAENCINQLNGKSVITSDHGELLGERATPLTHRRYGHPHNVYCRKLRIIPWLEIESQNRRDVIAEEPIKQQNIDTTIIDQRLQALGYKPV